MIRLLVADPNRMFRAALCSVLSDASDFEVVCETATCRHAERWLRHHGVDVALLDLTLPDAPGVEAVRRLRRAHPDVPLLVLDGSQRDALAVSCLRAGASGHLPKRSSAKELRVAVRRVAAGRRYLTEPIAERLADALWRGAPGRHALSLRELQVLRRIGRAQSPATIAADLGLSVKTVNSYRSRILTKLGLRNHAELVRYAIERHLVETSERPRPPPSSAAGATSTLD